MLRTGIPLTEQTLVAEILQHLLKEILIMVTRQQKDYLPGGQLNSLSQEQMSKAVNAPAHNVASESNLSMVDHLTRYAPNATIGHIDGKVKFRRNKTISWLQTKPEEELEKLFRFAVSYASKYRLFLLKRNKEVTTEISKRINDKQEVSVSKTKKLIVDILEEFIDLDSPQIFNSLTIEEKLIFEISTIDTTYIEDEDKIRQMSTFIYKPRNLLYCYFKQFLPNGGQTTFRVVSISKHKLPSDLTLSIVFTEHDGEEVHKKYSEFLAEFLCESIKMA
jgi:hypothetical protein